MRVLTFMRRSELESRIDSIWLDIFATIAELDLAPEDWDFTS